MLNIKIDKPIVFFDLETTGTNVQKDRIVEISVVKIQPSGEQEIKTRKINPEMPIPTEATEIHGITDADVAECPTFKSIAQSLYVFLEACDLGGYNLVRFDIPVLTEEFKRVGLDFTAKGRRVIDPFILFCKKESRSLVAAYQFYCNKELEGAHGAEADTLATIEVLNGQLEKYSDIPADIAGLDEFCNQKDPSWVDDTGKFKWQGSQVIVNFGKNSGTQLQDIAVNNPGFLQWMNKASFPEDAKKIALDALKGNFPQK